MRSFGQAALVCWTRWRLNWSSPPIPGYITISHRLTTRCHNLLVSLMAKNIRWRGQPSGSGRRAGADRLPRPRARKLASW